MQAGLFDEVPNEPRELPPLGAEWLDALTDEFSQDYWHTLHEFVAAERESQTVYPPAEQVFTAFQWTPLSQVRVVILGQDPYPGKGQGHGLAFSVLPGVRIPASLRNIYQELQDDLGIAPVKHGFLESWAKQGVFMLNTVLTVRDGKPNSHKGKGWEKFTDQVLKCINDRLPDTVIVLWGASAQKKKQILTSKELTLIESAHPSPLSAHSGFFGSKPFSAINRALTEKGKPPIDWQLPTSV
ncbi:MAG: uracil-DNA glycosylase [Zavarzinella sp.]